MFARVEPEVGSREWKDNYIYDNPKKFFAMFPEEASNKESALVAVSVHGVEGIKLLSLSMRDDAEVVTAAYEINEIALVFASDRLRDDFNFGLTAVAFSASNIQSLSVRLQEDREFIRAALNIYPPGRLTAFGGFPLPPLSDYFSDGLNEKLGGMDALEYFRREELFEHLQKVVPNKVSVVPSRKLKI